VLGFQVGEILIGFLMGAYVLARGLWFGKDAVLVLMDVSPSPQRVKEMKEIAERVFMELRGLMRLDCEKLVPCSLVRYMWKCRRGFLWKKRT
jgi:divalent metal cation (Fe/Co/Zn/Cd) transporter